MYALGQLALKFPLNVDHTKHSLVLSDYEERIRFNGIAPEIGVKILKQINEGVLGDTIAHQISPPAPAVAFIETLREQGLASQARTAPCTGGQMVTLLNRYYALWNAELFSHRLWTSLVGGTARSGVVDGWLIESYHFIRGANARLCYAASLCHDQRIRSIFAHHYVEEYDHYKFFAESLRRRGFDPDHVDHVGPLSTTLAVLNMARRAARIDPLAYAACSGLLESTGSDAGRARQFYRQVQANYDADGSGFVEPMITHIDLDEEYEHGSVMADVFSDIPSLTIDRANTVFRTVFQFAETLTMWFDDIETFYFSSPYRKTAIYRHQMSNQPT